MTNISKSFPGVKALKNVDFTVNKGEVMALMGENGAGKSTLIKIITGYYRRDTDQGEMLFDGKPINPADTLEAQRLGISTIFQELNLSPFLSVAENIYLGNTPRKGGLIDWKQLNENARKLMADLGVGVDVTAALNKQSIAVQQMVSIARALSIDTKLLIMDEATSSLDNSEVAVLFGIVQKLRQRGISTIFITHKMDEIYRICDRVTIFKDGMFIACEPIEQMPKLRLISLMIGRDAQEILDKRKEYDPAKQEAEILCSVKGIQKANHRLCGVDLEIRRGEVVGLAGLLGSGRTELAKVIFGDDQNYEGEICLRQQAVRFKSPSHSVENGLAFCSEDRKTEGIFPRMSINDNLTMSILGKLSRFGVLNKKKQRAVTEEYIEKIAVKTPSADTKIKNLSGGNQQKVILSRWLATHPDLIILDEPTRGIDVGAKGEIEELIKKIADQGISVLYISSELDELVRGCDRVAVLREGQKIAELTGEEISSDRIMTVIADHCAVY
ncbi:sugar ABC transporter ATP-binding protein [Oscillospiraceae bacterium MB08-C2-2]|nr:sugar ABC transporter ATP-binding protein [Oscillospiraceae bacterium MB08-C2-2]